MDDLTPKFSIPAADREVTIPTPFASDSTAQTVGGFMASPSALTAGNVTFNSLGEQILIGQASAPLTGVGVFIGNAGDGTYDFRAGDPAGNYIHWDASAATLTIAGSITATSGTIGGFNIGADYIRDVANTFGLASTVSGADDVRFWAGTSFASRATAPMRITESGAAVFQNVQIGGTTIQYVITDDGYRSFGDASDGSATISVNTTLSADKYYSDLTINTGVTLNPGGYRIFVKGTLTLNGTAKIARNGNNGGNGGTTVAGGTAGGTAGAALADGYLKGSVAGAAGASSIGRDNASGLGGVAGTNTSNSLGSNGAASGNSNNGVSAGGASGVSGGTATASNVKLIANWHLATLLDVSSSGSTVKFDNSAGAAGGASGGGGAGASGASGGGGASSGGVIAIYARNIIIGASASITAIGGNGGAGGLGNVNNGAGGGGGGGNGGIIILIYNTISNAGTLTVTAGTGGTGGASGASGTATAGANGTAGTTYSFQLSL
jgi:hypothetical protein